MSETMGCGVARRAPLERLWRALGYGWAKRPSIEHPHVGHVTTTHVCFDLADRLRVLLSGHVVVVTVTEMEAAPVMVAPSRVAVSILEPGAPNGR